MKTLALIFACALVFLSPSRSFSKEISPNPTQNKPTGGESEPPQSTNPLKQVDVTEPVKREKEKSYFYKFGEELSAEYGVFAANSPDGTLPVYNITGLTYLWDSLTRFHWESGLFLTNLGQANGDGQIWHVARWVSHFTDGLRPYWSVGVGVKLRSEKGLSNLVAISNYFARAACGFEYSLRESFSLKAEVFFGIDPLGNFQIGPIVGIVYGF